MTPMQWVVIGDTGISSKTLWYVMMEEKGVDLPIDFRPFDFDVPHDSADSGRCYRLLQNFPQWYYRLHEVSNKFPLWVGVIREWNTLERLYKEEKHNELYELLEKLIDEGRLADGWTKTGPGCWQKNTQ